MFQKRGVVTGGKLEILRVKDGDVGVEKSATEAHGFRLNGEALAFFQGDDKGIEVFSFDEALDGGVEFDPLCFCGRVVRFCLGKCGVGTDPEGAEVGDIVGGADAE